MSNLARVKRSFMCMVCRFSQGHGFDQCPQCGMQDACTSAIGPNDDATGDDTDPCPTFDEIEDEVIPRVTVCEPWNSLLGDAEHPGLPMTAEGSSALVYGPAGAGKTTLLLKLMASVRDGVWLPLERGQGPTALKTIAARTGLVMPPSMRVLPPGSIEEMCSALRARPRTLVVVDSISTFERGALEAWEDLRDACPGAAFWAVVHITKQGRMRGTEELAHVCDTVIQVTGRRISIPRKNRFGPPSSVANPLYVRKERALRE